MSLFVPTEFHIVIFLNILNEGEDQWEVQYVYRGTRNKSLSKLLCYVCGTTENSTVK
jgi:hypothetical protein